MELLTRPLEDALAQLESHMGLVDSELARDERVRHAFRTAAIQSFEYTYALAIALMTRMLTINWPRPEEVEEMELAERFRAAWEKGYVSSAEAWMTFRAMRNETAHTYKEENAAEVYAVLHDFAATVRHLLARRGGRDAR